MILQTAISSFHARPAATGLAALLMLAGLAVSPTAQAKVYEADPGTVTAGDTFGIELIGYNTTASAGNFYAIDPTLMATFGTTQTFAGAAANGQVLTVISTEATNLGITTDTIIISVPNGFIPAGTLDKNGNVVNALDFSIGMITNTGGTNPLNFNTSLSNPVVTGSVSYTYQGIRTSTALTQNPVFGANNLSFSDEEAVQSGTISGMSTAPISDYNVTSFTVTLTYGAVPEPSTVAAVLLGLGALGWVAVQRRARA